MDFVNRTVHPLGGFDLTAIGVVLVFVMIVLAWRRIAGARKTEKDIE
ncbi:MAG: hypothetical protein AAF619_00765 [Pseudomonadota bacterium]